MPTPSPERIANDQRSFTIPVEERIRYYHTLGYSLDDIAKVVSSEYQAFEVNTIDVETIRRFIKKNGEELLAARDRYALSVRQENAIKMRENFAEAQSTEVCMVTTFSKKIKELVIQLDGLDLTEKDEDGKYYKNIGSYGTIVMAINKTHETLEKLSGTASARSIMEHMKKAYIKESVARKVGLHKAAEEMEVEFMDENEVLKNFGASGGLPELKKMN